MFKHTLSFVASATLVATLEADTLTVDPIVVTATKTEQSLQYVASNIEIITGEELAEKHIATVTEALNLVSGISFTSNGGAGKSANLNLRGFDTKRVLVLIDGVRYNDPTGISGAPFEHLMTADIEQIEVVKGAQSGIWGADASAGVINIITKGAQKGLHGTLTSEYGSFNTKKYGASASYATDAYYFKASSNIVDTDGFTAQAPRGIDIKTLEDDGYKNTTTSLKLGYKIDSTNKIDLSHTIIDAKSAYDGCGNNIWKGSYYKCTDTATQQANNPSYNNTTKDNFTSLNFNHTDSFNTFDMYAARSKFERRFYDTQYYVGGADAGKTISHTSEFDGQVKEYGVKSKIPYRNSDFVVLGADYKNFEYLNDFNKKYNDKALFVTNNNVFNEQTIITESVRTDRYDAFNDKTTGKIGIKHNFNKELYLSSNYGTGYNAPTIYNLYSQYGSTSITPESTKSYDVSVGYKTMTLTYFYNTIDNMIDFDMATYTYNNLIGKSRFKGIEAAYKNEIASNTLLSLNYTRLNAKDKDGVELARRAKENLKFGVDYDGIDKLHLGIFGEYIGSRYDDKAQKKQTGRYTVTNAVVNYDLSKIVSVYGKVDNIANKYYQTIDGYATSPRAFYAGLKASF